MKYRRSVLILILIFIGFTPLVAQTQRGKATFYSKRATGARTASGERLHHDSLTCAHRTYPFGTLLKVTNMSNEKEVIVRVTDRGPFVRGRIIDLSWAAAKELGIISQGVATVKVELYRDAKGVPYRPDETIDLPEMDFEITEAGYSLMDEWQENARQEAASRRPAAKKPATAKPQTPKTTAPSARQKDSQKDDLKPQQKDKKEGNVWSNIFEKLKNW